MALHQIKNLDEYARTEELFADQELLYTLPKYQMPAEGSAPREVRRAVLDELMIDGNSRLNLATFCQTYNEEEVRDIMLETLDKNIIDKDEYPQTSEIENRCVHIMADLWNSPKAANTIGCSTTGSSEAAMLGGMALKWRWREKMRAQGKPTDKPNLIFGAVQVCWHKFTRYWDIEERQIPIEGNRFTMNAEEVLKRCDENTIGVIPTLGLTFTGEYEPIQEISDALDQFEKETGLNIPIHVDAASGGFIAPFLAPDLLWDFRLPRVKSINASGHKFGLAPLGVGWIIWRDRNDLSEDLVFKVNYLGGTMDTFAINFSRPGGQVITQYYNFLRLGKEGYRRVQQTSMNVCRYLADEIHKLGPFEILTQGDNGIPLLCWTLKELTNFTLFDFSYRLRNSGWQVPAYGMPAKRQDLVVQRIVCRFGLTRDIASLLIDEMKRALDYFKQQPVHTKIAPTGFIGGFNHL
ncbi:glutamate decarboxylase [Anthocerotibacter panamensis]|uniref:glutamate decarboxylase n=1 Tax=Anthocerotibacter panamensis TaxID=2857077 RepID=UPI001C40475C|nr:glutamate decarboxylase [Anthocerotibacter panamensis]